MRFVFNIDEIVKLNNTVQTISEADSAIVMQLGVKDMGQDKVLCNFRVTTQAEEISRRVIVDKPEGFDGSGVNIAVKSRLFGGLVSSLAAFKEDIFVDVEGENVKIGNSTTVVPVETLSNIPQAMNSGSQDAPLMQMRVKGGDFTAFIRRALECTNPEDTTYGLANAIVCVDSTTGRVRGLSSDSRVISYASMNAQMSGVPEGVSDEIKAQMQQQLEAMKANLDAHCKEVGQSADSVYLLFPTGAVQHLKKLIAGKDVVDIGVDKRRVYVAYDNSAVIYTFVQGRDRRIDFSVIESCLAQPSSASAQLDAAAFLRSVDFVNGTNKLTCTTNDLLPLKVGFADGQLLISSGKDFSIRNIVKANAISGEGTEILISGDYLKSRLEALDKGGACASVVGTMLILSNGTLDNTSEYKMFIGLIDPSEWMKQEDGMDEESEESAPVTEEVA